MQQPTMADVAKAAGVSKNTVSLALRASPGIAEETRKRIVEAAEVMGYRLNPTVSHLMAQLRQSRSPKVPPIGPWQLRSRTPRIFS